MDLSATQIIKEIGGGLAAVVIVAQTLAIVALYKSREKLIERLLTYSESCADKTNQMHEKTLASVGALTEATKASNAIAQAAVQLHERGRGRE